MSGFRCRLVTCSVLLLLLLVGVAVIGAAGVQSVATATSGASAAAEQATRNLTLGVAVAGMVVVAGAWWLVRLVTTGLRELHELLDAGAGGDLARRGRDTRRDEFGELVRRYGVMADSLSTTVGTVAVGSSGLAAGAEELTVAAAEIHSSATETAERSEVVAAAAEQVSSNVRTVAAATEEMSSSIREIAQSTSTAVGIASSAVSTARTANSTVARLGSSSVEIGNVVKLITSIAEQTNLLALNATIEAARAGEAGKGFAVVAGEVKDLARETAQATEDIGRRIEAIQTDSQAAADAISEVSGIIERINATQQTIASAVEEQTATTNEISRNISEAAQGADGIAESISAVAKAAAAAREGVGQTLALSDDLSRTSMDLVRTAAHFTVSAEVAGSAGTSVRGQITKAIGAHGDWKRRLASAVARRSHDEDVATVGRSDACEFGRWLRDLQPGTADEHAHREAGSLHAQFHREAARVLTLISGGDVAAAATAIAPGGDFAEASRRLTRVMLDWRHSQPAAAA